MNGFRKAPTTYFERNLFLIWSQNSSALHCLFQNLASNRTCRQNNKGALFFWKEIGTIINNKNIEEVCWRDLKAKIAMREEFFIERHYVAKILLIYSKSSWR